MKFKKVFYVIGGHLMYISKIEKIKNFRNLSNLEFLFDNELNFILGENNIGKTNLLELLNCLICKGKFSEEDFCVENEQISVVFTIQYSENELGFFENNFDIDDQYSITIVASQQNSDDRIEYVHDTPSKTYIAYSNIKMLNFVYYSSLRSPSKEINFSKNIGTGKVLNYLVKRNLESRNLADLDLINTQDVENILVDLNNQLNKLNGLSGESLKSYISEDKQDIINRILEIGDGTGSKLCRLGDGLQYSFNIFLNIIELLIHIKSTKREEDFATMLITDAIGKRYLPMMIALDEPEIHQHPYRQRALIKGVKKIIDNENKEFIELMQELFGIDGLIGQVFVVTHSPNILLNDYKQIIRFYKINKEVNVKCGQLVVFDDDKIHKHLLRSFIYFKEAMFSKFIILVEGDTEFGALPVLINKMGYDLDEKGIGIIKLDGADSVVRCMKLYKEYDMKSIAIIDRDKEETYKDNEGIVFTTEIDFEAEIYSCFELLDYLDYQKDMGKLAHFIKPLVSEVNNFKPKDFLEDHRKYDIPIELQRKIMSDKKVNEIEELRGTKNALNGALLAKYVTKIPRIFESTIHKVIDEVNANE